MSTKAKMTGLPTKLQRWLDAEESFARGPKSRGSGGESSRPFEASYVTFSAFESEFIALTEELPPVVEARLLMERGRFESAEHVLQSYLSQHPIESELLEGYIAKAKLLSISGRSAEAQEALLGALAQSPSSLRKLELYQLLALVEFEESRYSDALKALKLSESFSHFYPSSYSAFYSDVLKAKIHGRLSGAESMRKMLDHLWQARLASGQFNLDTLLTLARAEIDFAAISGRDSRAWKSIALVTAQVMGDELFIGLGLVDFLAGYQLQSGVPEWFQVYLDLYPRVQAAYKKSKKSNQIHDCAFRNWQDLYSDVQTLRTTSHIVSLTQSFIVSLGPFEVESTRALPTVVRLLEALSHGPLSKEEFYQKGWNLKNYFPERHDGLIRSSLHRIRKSCSLPVRLIDGLVHSAGVLYESQSQIPK